MDDINDKSLNKEITKNMTMPFPSEAAKERETGEREDVSLQKAL